MKRYQVLYNYIETNRAGSKAPRDIISIAEKCGYIPLYITCNTKKTGLLYKIIRQIGFLRCWISNLVKVESGSIILLQYPIYQKELVRNFILQSAKKLKHIKIISLVHDVDQLRYKSNNNSKEFKAMLQHSDVIIVHNAKMLQWFAEQNVEEKKLVNLQIFDYLSDNANVEYPKFKRAIIIAGNLDICKATYLSELSRIKNIEIHLYGPNYNENNYKNNNLYYHGSFPSDEIPHKLKEGFGLVWDGTSIEECTGLMGQYLKYNNPHKLSLFLVSGLPVVIWRQAAEADFVRKNGLGICVDSLLDLESALSNICEEEYKEMAAHVAIVGNSLKAGAYTQKALEEACRRINCHG